jgi:hypothetical protein
MALEDGDVMAALREGVSSRDAGNAGADNGDS